MLHEPIGRMEKTKGDGSPGEKKKAGNARGGFDPKNRGRQPKEKFSQGQRKKTMKTRRHRKNGDPAEK